MFPLQPIHTEGLKVERDKVRKKKNIYFRELTKCSGT